MNEFLQQFVIESRELIEQASAGLLRLEHAPQDAALLDDVFRAMHTLKGGAAIVGFAPMEQAVHAAEDVLGAVRAGTRVMTPDVLDGCLACLDAIGRWLDAIEQSGDLPAGADAAAMAAGVVSRLSRGALGEVQRPKPPVDPAASGWAAALAARHPRVAGNAATAVRFIPDAECFFQGEDPLNRLAGLPGLLALEAAGAAPWPPLDSMDCFRCNLALHALASCTAQQAIDYMQGHSGECLVQALAPEDSTARPDGAIPARARALLEAQRAFIEDPAAWESAGHLASAARTAANVLRSIHRPADAARLATLVAPAEPGLMLTALRSALAQVLDEAPAQLPAASDQPPHEAGSPAPSVRTLRVDAERVDALVRLAGELVVARNALSHLARRAVAQDNPIAGALKAHHADYDHLVGQLQGAVLALRVLPLRVVFQRFPRQLREMSERLGKPARLLIAGESTEADKAIIEMLFEPLLHVMRNAMDHGIESAAVRAARGKPPEATIQLRASRQGELVQVEVIDDGGGMDMAGIRSVARERGIADAATLDAMSEADITELVFRPGFSTATDITTVSGRGVGMDAVRIAAERVGGRVSILSTPERGTTVRFLLPVSVMMTTVMSLESAGQLFGVPLDSVVETLRVPRGDLTAVGAARAVVLRGRTIPVLPLAQMLDEPAADSSTDEVTLVIASAAGQYCGLEVTAVGERLDIMLKPLEGLLVGTPGIAGTTLTGEGRVMLVLDIAQLLQ